MKTVEQLVAEYGDYPDKILITGSSVICDPPVTTTDVDYVVVYNGALSAYLQSHGFDVSTHAEYPNDEIRACYRRDNINVIAVATVEDWDHWHLAHKLAKHMNLLEKHQRTTLFQFITEGIVRGTEIRFRPKPAKTSPSF